MSTSIQPKYFTQAVYALLDETFDNVQGYYLDKDTSLFETLTAISAKEVSIPVGGQCATLAAQVKHVAFYLDIAVIAHTAYHLGEIRQALCCLRQ